MNQDRLRAIVFPGVQNLPIFAAEACGFFKQRDIDLHLTFTASSQEQRDGLVEGTHDIAHSAIDNAVALADVAGQDVISFIGLERSGTNKLVVQPKIRGYDDLRGRVLGVDAPDTAFAFLAYDLLERHGLKRNVDYEVLQVGATKARLEGLIAGRCDCALLMLPFWLQAEQAGLLVLDDPHASMGAYQGNAGFATRSWAADHDDLLVRYIASNIEGLRWVLAPANRTGAADLLTAKMHMDEALALRCCELILGTAGVFAKDAKLDMEGLETVLQLRARFSGRATRPAAAYMDETYYERALNLVGTTGS